MVEKEKYGGGSDAGIRVQRPRRPDADLKRYARRGCGSINERLQARRGGSQTFIKPLLFNKKSICTREIVYLKLPVMSLRLVGGASDVAVTTASPDQLKSWKHPSPPIIVEQVCRRFV